MPEPTKEALERSWAAIRVAAAVLGPTATEKQVEDFGVDLMPVPTHRLFAILHALPNTDKLPDWTLPDRQTIWARLKNDD